MIVLRDYQEKLKIKARESFKKNKKTILLAPCGSGKTVISISIIKDSLDKGKKVWFIVHRQELLTQAENTLKSFGIPKEDIGVYMVQSLAHRLDKIEEKPDLIIMDECFVKGTLIDGKPIENIKVGDYIKSYNHTTNNVELKKVLNVFKRKPKKLLKITLNNGKEIICTSNHPFYTKDGYIEACKLKEKDELYLLWEKSYFKTERVESIQIQKPTSDGTFGGVCEDGYVYNIEVKDNNNYFANEILVHNCQHASSVTYRKIIDRYPDAYILGLSATPTRLTGKPLGDIFENIVAEVEAEELIERGFLAKYDYYAPKLDVDFTQIKIKTTGDYDTEQVENQLSNSTIYGDIIKYYKKLAEGKKTIVYCPTINYSLKIEKMFNDNGYVAKHFDGCTSDKERKQIIEDFRDGKINVLTNVDLIGEGFDVKDCECVLLLRPTQSLSLYIQQSTRCLRPNGDKKSIIIDFVGNCYRHGMPTEKREWSLTKTMKCKNPSGENAILLRQCPNCYKVYIPTTRICPYCKYEAEPTAREIKEEQKAELERIEKVEKYKRKNEVWNCKTYGELVAYAKEHNYKNAGGWAYYMMQARKKKGIKR